MTDEQPGGTDEPVGSVAEEAAALLAALSGYAREHLGGPSGSSRSDSTAGSAAAAGASGALSAATEALRSVNEHIATGSAECTYCPICQVIHTVRSTSPEVRAHLAVAANSLLQAASSALAGAGSGPGSGGSAGPVEHIDLDGDEPRP